jgi:hypothetical protein
MNEQLIKGIDAIRAASLIEGKKSKGNALPENGWKEVWLENLAKYGVKASPAIEEPDKSAGDRVRPEAVDVTLADLNESSSLGMRAEEVLTAIRGLADNPEKLLEAHLGLFIDPAPPGKLLNSQG